MLTGIAYGGTNGVSSLKENLHEPRGDETAGSSHADHLPFGAHVASFNFSFSPFSFSFSFSVQTATNSNRVTVTERRS